MGHDDDLREAVTTLEDDRTDRAARIFGGAHPDGSGLPCGSREPALRARDTPSARA